MSPRRKRTLGIAACLAAAALVVPQVVRVIARSLEPHYQGRAISSWMAQLAKDQFEPAELQETTNAIAHIGVPALPFLLKWLKYEPPRWKAALAQRTSGYRLPFANNQLYYKWVTDRRAYELADATYFGFQALGKRAMPAFNELCQIMNHSSNAAVAGRAAAALTCVGTNALPPLLEAVANPQHPAQLEALNSLCMVPEVVEAVEAEASGAASFLGLTNKEPTLVQINLVLMRKGFPQVSIPAVAASMASPNLARARAVIKVITPAGSGRQDSNVVTALAKALGHPDINVRRYATNALLEIAPEALANASSQ